MPAALSLALRWKHLPDLLAASVLLYAAAGLLGIDRSPGLCEWLTLGSASLALLAQHRAGRWLALALGSVAVVLAATSIATAHGVSAPPWLAALRPETAIAHAGALPLPAALSALSLALAIVLGGSQHAAFTAPRLLLALPFAMPAFALAGDALPAPELPAWKQVTELSLAFSLAQFALAVSMALGMARRYAQSNRALRLRHVSVELLVVFLLVSGMLFWRALVVEAEESTLDLQNTEFRLLDGRLQSSVAAFRRPVIRMAERWDLTEGTEEAAWRLSARSLLRDIPGMISLQWLDATGMVRWAEPMPAMQHLVGTRPNQDPQRRVLLEAARSSGDTVFSEPIELLQGGLGLLLFAPLKGGDGGTLVAVLRFGPRFENVIELSTSNPALAIGYREVIAYSGPRYTSEAVARNGVLRQSVGEPMPEWWMAAIAPQPDAVLLRLPSLALGFSIGSALLMNLILLWWRQGLRRERALSEAGDALVEANRRFAMATQVARIGVWEWRRESRELLWDEQARTIFAAVDDMRPALDIIEECLDPLARRTLAKAVRSAAQGAGVLDVDLAARRLDGHRVDLHLTARLLRHARQRSVRLLGVVVDVTERQRLERLKNAFVSTVSHELRTPLTAINGALAILDAGALAELPPPVAQLVAVSRQNTRRLSLLIDDLLDLERLAQGGLQLSIGRIDLCDALSRAVSLNQGYADGLGVQLETCELQAPVWVRADPDRLQQVLANLLANAAKFSIAGQSVQLELRTEGSMVRVEVRDRGSGVPEDFRPRLFSRFSQADGSDARRYGGTGLGLAICSELINTMDGAIGYEPREGGGSVFWFSLLRAADLGAGD